MYCIQLFLFYWMHIMMMNEYRRIKNMLDNKTSSDSKRRSAFHEALLESLQYAEEDLQHANDELSTANEELSVVNAELNIANEEIAKLKLQNEKLRAQLNAK